MADTEVIDLSKARRVPVKQADMAVQIREQLRQDAHKQKSHREFDEYMSQNQSGYVLTAMLQALSDEPQNPFKAMADRLRAPNEGHNLTVIGTDLQEIMRKDPYLSQLHSEIFDDIFQHAEELDFQKGQLLFKKGENADALALITRGSVRVGERIITRGHMINMNAMHVGSVYNDDVVGEESGKYVVLDKGRVNQVLLNSSIKESYTRGSFFQNVLKQRFPQLSQSEILLLSQLAKPVVYEPGQIIAEKNDQLNSFVIITQVFGLPAAEAVVDAMHSNVDDHLIFQEKPVPRPDEAAVTPGNIIGLEGVLIGREERRDWICDGVVEGYVIEAEDLKLRGELMKKLKENIQ